ERKVVPFSRSEKEEAQFEEHVEPKEVERVKPRVTPAEKPPLRTAAMPFQAKGGFQIKPIFSEDMGAKKEETADEEPTATFADKQVPVEKEADEPKSPEEPVEASDDEESDVRMARIQRIIDELSPDKFKAQLDQPQKKKKLPEPEEDEGERAAEIEEDEKPVPKKTTEPEENEDSDEGEDGKNEKIKIPVSKIQQAKGKILPKLSSKEAKAAKGKAALAKQSPAKLPSSKKQLARVMPQALPVQKKTAPVQRKAAPAIAEEAPEKIAPVREEKPERVAPVQRRMPVREEEPEPEKEEAQAAIPVARVLPQKSSATSPSQSSGARPRIFPGGVKPPTPNTYITPVRTRALEKPPEETIDEAVEDNEETAAPVAKPVIVQKKMQPLVPKEPEEEPAEAKTQDETADEQEEKPAISKAIPIKKIPQPQTQGEKVLTSKPKKLVLEESVEETPSIEQLKERSHIKELGEKFVRMTSHDIAGEAKLPNDKDESESDLEVPKPPRADAPPKPAEYAQAKENLRHKEQQEEIVEGAKKENEEMLESYAKDNLTWLYEIYKMGGIAREAFLQKVQEKIDEERGAGEIEKMEVDPDNPALAALGKELGEKKKKWPF
ncbi:MAG: hypothetical protein NTV88_02735, partial [Candidatus Micrarchaeota archaeon]|nr:hypothetical protein [Candidatus Micrarchaeota archaeon]